MYIQIGFTAFSLCLPTCCSRYSSVAVRGAAMAAMALPLREGSPDVFAGQHNGLYCPRDIKKWSNQVRCTVSQLANDGFWKSPLVSQRYGFSSMRSLSGGLIAVCSKLCFLPAAIKQFCLSLPSSLDKGLVYSKHHPQWTLTVARKWDAAFIHCVPIRAKRCLLWRLTLYMNGHCILKRGASCLVLAAGPVPTALPRSNLSADITCMWGPKVKNHEKILLWFSAELNVSLNALMVDESLIRFLL